MDSLNHPDRVIIEQITDADISNDAVNHPSHYTFGGIECIDAIKAALGEGFKPFLQGQVLKYIWRYQHKNKPVQDLEKARWYLNRLIKEMTETAANKLDRQ